MEFEVYCDEAHPDVLTSASPRARHLMIGSLWLPAGLRGEIKNRIHALRQRHSAWGEIKWTKVSRNRQENQGRRVVGAGDVPGSARRKGWPLICYAGPATETSIGSKPIGSELRGRS